ncbi:uncharacterized protein [Onthophagus taurus]|uniref:uncharacterized protein n=1 Tax=Onthophagus taurus TaxID=166361 RepID=UPI0039BE26AC
MDVATCLRAHSNNESAEFQSCSSDSDGKSDLDEDYYQNLPPPIPGETLLSSSISINKSLMQESRPKLSSYSDILKSSPQEKSSDWTPIKKKRTKKKNETKNDKLSQSLSNLSLNEGRPQISTPIRNHQNEKLLLDTNKLSKIVREEVKKQFDELKSEYELKPKVEKKSVENVAKQNLVAAQSKLAKPVQNSSGSVRQGDGENVLVEKKKIRKILNYIDNVEQCMKAIVKSQDFKRKPEEHRRMQHCLESLRYAYVSLKQIQD